MYPQQMPMRQPIYQQQPPPNPIQQMPPNQQQVYQQQLPPTPGQQLQPPPPPSTMQQQQHVYQQQLPPYPGQQMPSPMQQSMQPPVQPPMQPQMHSPMHPPMQSTMQPPNYQPEMHPYPNNQPMPMRSQQQQPGYRPPYQPMYQPPPRQTKLDPNAMPSVAQLTQDELDAYKRTDRQLIFTAPASLPPLVSTLESQQLKISLQDAGCVRPCHMRSTIYQIPTSKDLLDASGLEFSVVVKPFDEGEVDGKYYIPLSMNEIVRCNRCKAYANPFSKNAQCCICKYTTQGIQEPDQRPELNLGSYEFRVTQEYYRNQIAATRRPHIIFAIEMTVNSRHLVQFVSKNLAEVIKNYFPKDFLYSASLLPLVGFVTYNSKITIYDVLNGGHAYVISDMTSVTDCTSTSKFLVDPKENYEEIKKFLNSLEELCNSHDLEQQTILGPAIEAALKTVAFDTSNNFENGQTKLPSSVIPAGKVYILHSSLPTYGEDTTPGKLSTKRNIDEIKRQLGTETENKVLAVEGKYYTQLAQKCIQDYASGVELFLFPPHPRAYLNIATLSELSRLTGTGVVHKYHLSSLDNFIQDLKISFKSTMGFDASMRVRTSTGISPVRYIGNFNNVTGSNLEMSAVNTNSNFIVQMKYDDKLPENDLVIVQFAMIYTSICGERRVRVHNLALSTCQVLADLYKSACCDTFVNVLVRDAVHKMRAGSLAPKAAKEAMTARVINILCAYRKHCTENQASTSSQLILPESLKLLPVYLCGAIKCDAIDGGMEMFPDDKVLAQLNLLGALPSQSQATVYPRMYAINACEAGDEENDYGLTAFLTRCYILAIEEAKGHCYILENGYYLFIYFPSTELGQSYLQNVFGVRKDDPDLLWELRDKDSNESKFIEELIERIIIERRRALSVFVVRQGRDKMEGVFKTFLYEDKKRLDGAVATSKLADPSYVDILCYIHDEVRSKMSQL